MLTFMLAPGVVFSDATDWTVARKAMAIVWLVAIDSLVILALI